jgi:sporulation protein YunB
VRRRVHKRKIKKRYVACAAALILSALLYAAHLCAGPVIKTVSGNQARILCTAAINRAVLDELSRSPVQYGSFVGIIKDDAGNVAALETDALALSRLKATLTEAVNQALAALPQQDVRIPLGTLTGIELLSGRGPGVKLKMMPSSYIESEIINHFDSAGINQTRHAIAVIFTVSVSAILAPYITTVTVTAEVVVAETVIVGPVPNFWAGYTGQQAGLRAQIGPLG